MRSQEGQFEKGYGECLFIHKTLDVLSGKILNISINFIISMLIIALQPGFIAMSLL